MHFTPRSASSSSLDAYVGGSQSLRYAKTSFPKVCIPSSHPYQALVLISTAQCITGLRSKRVCADPGAITATLPLTIIGRGCLRAVHFPLCMCNREHMHIPAYYVYSRDTGCLYARSASSTLGYVHCRYVGIPEGCFLLWNVVLSCLMSAFWLGLLPLLAGLGQPAPVGPLCAPTARGY